MKAKLTEHASFEAQRRNISEKLISSIVENPQQRLLSSKKRVILQSRYIDNSVGNELFLRIIGKEKGDIFNVIIVYRTSKIDKYWEKEG